MQEIENRVLKLSISVIKHTQKSLEYLKTNDYKRAFVEAKNAKYASKQLANLLYLVSNRVYLDTK
jgi:hypothetical protein